MDINYGPDRRFFRWFSIIKGYDGYLIGKLSCHRICQKLLESETGKLPDVSGGNVRVRKRRKNFAILELSGEEYILTTTLLCPSSLPRHTEPNKTEVRIRDTENKIVVPENVIARRSFAAEEILDFVQDVQDTNGIHQMPDPVVPGLLMAEWFFSVLHSSDWETAEIRFHMPAYAGQNLCLCRQSKRYDCLSEETGQLFWTGSLRYREEPAL